MHKQGQFIVVEGLEGAGKSSAIVVIEQVLQQHHINYIKTREPGGTELAEQLRAIVKSSPKDEMITAETELLIMYASRSQLLANKIKPALNQGLWVIGDRHDLSSRAYQGGGRQLPDETLAKLAEITLGDFKPNLTILMDIEPQIGLARAKARGELDRIEQEQLSFFERVRAKYLAFAQQDHTIKVVDASNTIEVVQAEVAKQVEAFIKAQV